MDYHILPQPELLWPKTLVLRIFLDWKFCCIKKFGLSPNSGPACVFLMVLIMWKGKYIICVNLKGVSFWLRIKHITSCTMNKYFSNSYPLLLTPSLPNFLDPIFCYIQSFLEPKLFGREFFGAEVFLDPKSFWTRVFRPENLSNPNFFKLKNLLDQNFYGHKICCTKILDKFYFA